MKKIFAGKCVFIVLFALGFLCFNIDFRGPDEPVYLAYTASAVEDGDFNVLDEVIDFTRIHGANSHIRSLDRVNITPTGFLPDYHNHAGTVFWFGFYGYADIFYSVFDYFVPLFFEHSQVVTTVMAFSTLLFGLGAFAGMFYLLMQYYSLGVSLASVLLIAFGTPVFYFLTRETGNGQAMASFLAVLSVLFWSYAHKMRTVDYFFYGIFFSMCAAIKIDLVFQIFFITSYYAVLFLQGKTSVVKGFAFCTGAVPALALKLFNDYIKYGSFRQGEVSLLNFKSFYFFEQLFSSYRGFFYTSPLLLICLLGLIFYFKDAVVAQKNKAANNGPGLEMLVLCLGISFLAKIFILSFRYAWGGGTPGARILISESVLFALLYARVGVLSAKRWFKVVLGTFSGLCVVWNFIVIGEFISGDDLAYMTNPPALLKRAAVLPDMLAAVFGFADIQTKLVVLWPLVVVVLGFVFFGKRFFVRFFKLGTGRSIGVMPSRPSVLLRFAGLWMLAVYLVLSVSNRLCSVPNTKLMQKRGYYINTVVVGESDFENNENLGSLDEMEQYFSAVGKNKMVSRVKKIRQDY